MTVDHTFVEDPKVHHSFTVEPRDPVRPGLQGVSGAAESGSSTCIIGRRGFSPDGNCIFSIPVAIGWNCATRPGMRACRSREPSRTRHSVTGLASVVGQGDIARHGHARAATWRGERLVAGHAGLRRPLAPPFFPWQAPQRRAPAFAPAARRRWRGAGASRWQRRRKDTVPVHASTLHRRRQR